MKNIIIPVLAIHILFSQEIIEFKTGTSFGECLGYCSSDLRINTSNMVYNLYSGYQNDLVYLPVIITDTIDLNLWGDLNTQFDFQLFMSLDTVIGCPDCVDGGSEWFEVVTNDTSKKVTIEYGDNINGLNNYLTLFRTVRQNFEDIESCYYIPNIGPCDAVFPRYYFNQLENNCLEFIWGGCGGLVPFEDLEECESSCIDYEQNTITESGYLRKSEATFCMDNCSQYYLETEYGEFISWVTNLENINILDNYKDRYVNIEGESIECIECSGINISNIEISNNCSNPLNCVVDPCNISHCYSQPESECIANYCGGCWSDYYLESELIQCGTPEGCLDLTGIDFGSCEMHLGIGWRNNHCESISGCDWVIDSIDYSSAFYDSMEDCQQSCMSLKNSNDLLLPSTYHMYENFPNPFNPYTTIKYFLPKESFVDITIYNLIGNIILNLVHKDEKSGYHSVSWNGINNKGKLVSAGIYLYKIEVEGFSETKKMALIK